MAPIHARVRPDVVLVPPASNDAVPPPSRTRALRAPARTTPKTAFAPHTIRQHDLAPALAPHADAAAAVPSHISRPLAGLPALRRFPLPASRSPRPPCARLLLSPLPHVRSPSARTSLPPLALLPPHSFARSHAARVESPTNSWVAVLARPRIAAPVSARAMHHDCPLSLLPPQALRSSSMRAYPSPHVPLASPAYTHSRPTASRRKSTRAAVPPLPAPALAPLAASSVRPACVVRAQRARMVPHR
ncbi:hypothetical protein B0H15DRAFT_159767 [Mycena belliarum]|uniref:Uncharacterized protein n=1 Tax=Mycena belliarum TaxID=1033014 RepID=A0AAD6TM00_9AGAR|nr:hypothetical protein B0H15DRAFT_159767 [Mycena belliae]